MCKVLLFYAGDCVVDWSVIGRKSAATVEITSVKRMILVLSVNEDKIGSIAADALRKKLTMTRMAMVGFFFAGGIITARNIPYKDTLKALTIRSGKIFPIRIPSEVPIAQRGTEAVAAP